MTEIDRAQSRAMHCLSEWVNAFHPKFNSVEMQGLKQRMTAAFREYETECEQLREQVKWLEIERDRALREFQPEYDRRVATEEDRDRLLARVGELREALNRIGFNDETNRKNANMIATARETLAADAGEGTK